MKALSNLPPGCSESDLPSNRPEDVAWGKYLEEVLDTLAVLGLDVSELAREDERFVMDAIEREASWRQDEEGFGPAERIAESVLESWHERKAAGE